MKYAAIAIAVAVALAWAVVSVSGDGSFKRMVTISGVYSVCKPDGFEVVCFLDADGKEGGMSCLPLSQVGGGACK
jgi:hypothetical protein